MKTQPQRNNDFLQLIDCNEYKYMFHKYDITDNSFRDDYKELTIKAKESVRAAGLSLELEKLLLDYVEYVEFYMEINTTYVDEPAFDKKFYKLFVEPLFKQITPSKKLFIRDLREIVVLNTTKDVDFAVNCKGGLEFDSIMYLSRLYMTPIINSVKLLTKNLCKNNCNELYINVKSQTDSNYNRWTIIEIDSDAKLDSSIKYRVRDYLYEYAQSFYVGHVDLLQRWTPTDSGVSIQIIIPR